MSNGPNPNVTSTIHSQSTMEWPKAKQEAMEKQRQQKENSTAHFPNKNPPREKRHLMAQPSEDTGDQRPVSTQTPGVTHNGMAPQAFQTPPVQSIPAPGGQAAPFAAVAHRRLDREIPTMDVENVPNEAPVFTNPIADGEATSLALPSRFAFYSFKDLYVTPFRAKHIAKLQRAHREKSLLPIVEAVSSVIFTTEENHAALAFELTLKDFFFVLYWLRLNAYTKSNYIHETYCENPEHIKRVEDFMALPQYRDSVQNGKMTVEEYTEIEKNAMPEESLEIKELIRQSEMKVNELENIPDPEIYHFSDTSAMIFRPPTMKDTIEFVDLLEKIRSKEDRMEFSFLANLASHIQHKELVLPLDTRIKIVEEATSDQVELLKEFEEAIRHYGVDEYVKVQCKGCGASKDSKLVLDAFSFLPFNKSSRSKGSVLPNRS